MISSGIKKVQRMMPFLYVENWRKQNGLPYFSPMIKHVNSTNKTKILIKPLKNLTSKLKGGHFFYW